MHRLRIGCIHYLPLQPLQAFLGSLYEREPGLRTEVMHLRTEEQLELLRACELDLAIVHEAVGEPDLAVAPLYRGELLAAFIPVDHPLTAHESIGPRHLAHELLVVPRRAAAPALHDEVRARLASLGYALNRVEETAGAHPRDLLLATTERVGVALAPASTARVAGDAASIVTPRPLDPAPRMPDLVVAWRAGAGPPIMSLPAVARRLRSDR
jgi:hypothetical protein